MLAVHDLRRSYGEVEAVRGISFNGYAGEVAVTIGPSGCGRSTTLRCHKLLEEPTGGSLRLDDLALDCGGRYIYRSAQRRPEPEPRRHYRRSRPDRARTTSRRRAQRRPESEPRRHGYRSGLARQGQASGTLNEGRSLNPGDTTGSAAPALISRVHLRSTKAGV